MGHGTAVWGMLLLTIFTSVGATSGQCIIKVVVVVLVDVVVGTFF